MIEVKNLVKLYGDKRAVDDVTFTVQKGEVLGFLGQNGAGKSTTMNIITGYLSSTSGTVTIDGHEILEEPIEVKNRIGYLPEHPPLYLDMTVKDYLGFMFDLKKVKLPKKQHIEEICNIVKIADVYNRVIKNLSKGYRQRVGLAQALLGNPDVLIMDEPTVGLDPKQMIEIRNLIKSLGERHTVILSSHILSEVQMICDRVIVINKGKLVADGTPDSLSQSMSTDHKLLIRVAGPQEEIKKLLQKIPGMLEVSLVGQRETGEVYDFSLEAEKGLDIRREVFKRLAERSWPLLGMRSSELSLEDIFLQLTAEDSAASETENGGNA
ncbi:MAG: ATP-binding cassette domain-containing protein [Oscillospiraceae bacterium]|jgi:ABC-2 type transport system ATP-binding protein|nr:ATP-binding cassette domain-containing protein [Oscillospiraceae bacterium]